VSILEKLFGKEEKEKPCGCTYTEVKYVNIFGNTYNSKSFDREKIPKSDVVLDSPTEYKWEDIGEYEQKKVIHKIVLGCNECGHERVIKFTPRMKDKYRKK
jgi:hypothetical protein